MAWVFSITGETVASADGTQAFPAYSGHGDGRSDPSQEAVPDVGPIPEGTWRIGGPFDSPEHGPYCLTLVPVELATALGRSAFLIHGDSVVHPGQASEGCVVTSPESNRVAIWTSGDHYLQVTK